MVEKKKSTEKKKRPSSPQKEKQASPPAMAASQSGVAEPSKGFPIVGIGASAGGLAAFEAFFSGMPAEKDSGMAFVLVQHLAPDHKSILCDLVKHYTRMRVFEVTDGMPVEPDCAYIIPPKCDMAFIDGTLQLLAPTAPRGLRLPIDYFFRSLAQDQRERAICIVLSGTGSDGTLGARAVKGEGGLLIVQDPDSTEFDGMPRSAMATGLVDYVLPPAEMVAQLMAYAHHAFGGKPSLAASPAPKTEHILKKICILLRDQIGHDFSQYKTNTLLRCVERRMAIQQIGQADHYLRYLQNNPPESEALFRDLLIGVTGFFRDPAVFDILETDVIPRLLAGQKVTGTVRVWVCGCSTGEEAYSLAMLIQEHLESLKKACIVQIFATDIDPQAIAQARSGVYPVSIAADVSAERLARFFEQDSDEGGYRIRKSIRDLIIFSEQDVIKDPPFSKLDMLSCRNLLIYLNTELQKKLIPLFHYALKPDGVMLLGTSESVGEFATLFKPLDRKWKIYQRQTELPGALRPTLGQSVPPLTDDDVRSRQAKSGDARIDLRALTEQSLLRHYAQVGVLIGRRGEILHIHGRTGKYLEPAPGRADMNILTMAREGLRRELTAALHRAVTHKETVGRAAVRVRTNGDYTTVNLTVAPAVAATGEVGPAPMDAYLVILEEVGSPEAPPLAAETADARTGSTVKADEGRIAELEQELRAKEEYLQTTLEEMETANEELKSTNEELQSVNEELQSTNEELETSKEELQSVNEELSTVNAELQTKVSDLSRANNDMNNLMAGTGVGTLFVDHQLRIARFTPAATQIINLIQTDIGRPVAHIVSNLANYDCLVADVTQVLDTLVPHEAEVRTKAGEFYLMRIRPYRTLENVIEGAVITFVEISRIKQVEARLHAAQTLAENVVDTVREPLVVLDHKLRVVSANRAFYSRFQLSEAQAGGRQLYELNNGQWDIADLRRLLEEILPDRTRFDHYRVTLDMDGTGPRELMLNARRIDPDSGEADGRILLAIEDAAEQLSADGPAQTKEPPL